MRLFILLAAAAVAVLNATKMNKLDLGGPFENGTLITFWFKHIKSDQPDYWKESESAVINFYDSEPDTTKFDHTNLDHENIKKMIAHIRIANKEDYPVITDSGNKDTGLYGVAFNLQEPDDQYRNQEKIKTTTFGRKPHMDSEKDKWWRVDVYKHDAYHLSVFFQGFWAEVRKFPRSLDDVKSIYLISGFVDHDSVQIYVKKKNDITPMTNWVQMNTYMQDVQENLWTYIAFAKFPINKNIEMTTVLKATNDFSAESTASLEFFEYTKIPSANDPNGVIKEKPFLKIVQIWQYNHDFIFEVDGEKMDHYNNMELWITEDPEFDYDHQGFRNIKAVCTFEAPHGDLQHLLLTRTGENQLKMSVFFKSSHPTSALVCEYNIDNPDAIKALNGPFKIRSKFRSLILHIETDAPQIQKHY